MVVVSGTLVRKKGNVVELPPHPNSAFDIPGRKGGKALRIRLRERTTASMDQPTSPRPHRPRAFSHRSDKSNGSKGKADLVESPAEKAKRDGIWQNTSKANPNAAINEAQPGAAAFLEESTLQPLRDITHKDVHGNVIADPDLSNPTRPRLERPLDTIRSFEKAIDNGYKRRSSYRSESYQDQNSRRSSGYFGGNSNENNANRQGQNGGGYYGGARQDSYGPGGPRTRYSGSRMQSESAIQRPYGQHGYHQSQHTMNTDPGSDSTGPWANSTDPSSENSSLDPNNSFAKQPEQYGPGVNGYGNPNAGGFAGPIFEEQGQGSYGGAYQGQDDYSGRHVGAPPVQAPHEPRRPIQLGNSGNAPLPPGKLPATSRPEPEKERKSWLKRRFSKNK
nr:uncharacterized protein c19c7.04c [Quercus suber]